MIWLIGTGDFLLIWAPAALLAGVVGIWLFYVQHQFEDAYWQRSDSWSYADAGDVRAGSRCIRLTGASRDARRTRPSEVTGFGECRIARRR